jgi:hypothetical protein
MTAPLTTRIYNYASQTTTKVWQTTKATWNGFTIAVSQGKDKIKDVWDNQAKPFWNETVQPTLEREFVHIKANSKSLGIGALVTTISVIAFTLLIGVESLPLAALVGVVALGIPIAYILQHRAARDDGILSNHLENLKEELQGDCNPANFAHFTKEFLPFEERERYKEELRLIRQKVSGLADLKDKIFTARLNKKFDEESAQADVSNLERVKEEIASIVKLIEDLQAKLPSPQRPDNETQVGTHLPNQKQPEEPNDFEIDIEEE